MSDKKTLFIKCDCGAEHQLWDCDFTSHDSEIVDCVYYSYTCGKCDKLFDIHVYKKIKDEKELKNGKWKCGVCERVYDVDVEICEHTPSDFKIFLEKYDMI